MKYPKLIWDQLKNKTCDEIIAALEKDGFQPDTKSGAERVYRRPIDGKRVIIHYHPHKTYQPKQLKTLLAESGWTTDDFRRLKLIK